MVVTLRRTFRQRKAPHHRATALASAQLDTMADERATSGEVEDRKQRLLQGPAEFRDSRSDQVRKKPSTKIPAERKLATAAEGMAAYREGEAATQTNLQRLKAERLARDADTPLASDNRPDGKKRGM